MYKFLSILIIGLVSIGCVAKNSPITIQHFTEEYLDSLSNRIVIVKFQLADDSTIVTKFKDNDVRISVENPYREYQSAPDSLQKIISRYVTIASGLFKPIEKIDIDRIVPIIKPIEYLEEMKNLAQKMGGKKANAGFYDKYNAQLIIIYAEDKENSINYLTESDMRELTVAKDSLRTIATRNLYKLLTNIEKKGDDGTYMITAGGNYEASIILFNNLFNKADLPVKGNIVIAIPNRDMLLITGSDDKKGMLKIKELSAKAFATGDHAVSEYLYKWDGDIFMKYK